MSYLTIQQIDFRNHLVERILKLPDGPEYSEFCFLLSTRTPQMHGSIFSMPSQSSTLNDATGKRCQNPIASHPFQHRNVQGIQHFCTNQFLWQNEIPQPPTSFKSLARQGTRGASEGILKEKVVNKIQGTGLKGWSKTVCHHFPS